MSGALGLARIGQAAALATHEDVAAGVQLRHPPSAALTISGILSAQESRTSAAEMAPRPRERHALLYGFPLFLFRSTPREQQNHGVACWCELDGPVQSGHLRQTAMLAKNLSARCPRRPPPHAEAIKSGRCRSLDLMHRAE